MKTHYLEWFIPDEYLLQLFRFTVRIILSILAGTAILYTLSCACVASTLFIHSFTGVCHALYISLGCSPYLEIAAFVFLMLLNVKFAHMIYLSIFKEVKYER